MQRLAMIITLKHFFNLLYHLRILRCWLLSVLRLLLIRVWTSFPRRRLSLPVPLVVLFIVTMVVVMIMLFALPLSLTIPPNRSRPPIPDIAVGIAIRG